jgi:hypothetical protein
MTRDGAGTRYLSRKWRGVPKLSTKLRLAKGNLSVSRRWRPLSGLRNLIATALFGGAWWQV